MGDLQRWLTEQGWAERDTGSTQYLSPDLHFVVIVVAHMPWWALGLYDEQGEFRHITDGTTLEQLKAAMQLVPLESRAGLESQDQAQRLRVLAMAGCTPEEIEYLMNLERSMERATDER